MDRIYTVHPQQMHVNRPSLIPDSDPPHAASDPSSHNLLVSETAVQQMNIRIRIAEISREIVDALPLGSGDLDTLPYSKIASLDKKYETILAQLQPTAAATVNTTTTTTTTGSTSPLDAHRATRKIALERSIAVLSVSARRAKLLRPLLQIKDMPQRFEVFRKQCLHSTQTVIEIASTVLSETVDTPPNQSARGNRGGGSRYHSGLIIMHVCPFSFVFWGGGWVVLDHIERSPSSHHHHPPASRLLDVPTPPHYTVTLLLSPQLKQ